MKGLRERFAMFITRLNCLVNGHSDVVILTRYDETTRVKFTGNLSEAKNKGIQAKQVHRVKARCRRCGRTFLDYAGDTW